jgi:hypothetical protein
LNFDDLMPVERSGRRSIAAPGPAEWNSSAAGLQPRVLRTQMRRFSLAGTIWSKIMMGRTTDR